ncbi:recombinase RecT (plasmid) [Vibrio sp. SS-MA-C1-2]|uniref:recombinase RecT n=1 Tax=Vibrio sp. SS-MA-C1-2 TaxID=2908646 RepID=UPI001F4692D4|nr:recombinase RecT [Vibrio sp. SS-MA-C1-2]UJF20345.1 recombinase RecT [Vibrio sp. SS-MA-C1-2]
MTIANTLSYGALKLNQDANEALEAARPDFLDLMNYHQELNAEKEWFWLIKLISDIEPEYQQMMDAQSVYYTTLAVAQVGLSLNPVMDSATIMHFFNDETGLTELIYVPIYHGMIRLLIESTDVVDVSAGIVYHGDHFLYHGPTHQVEHSSTLENTAHSNIAHAYAVVKSKDGSVYTELLESEYLQATIAKFQQSPLASSLWNDENLPQMIKKTVIRRAIAHTLDTNYSISPAFKARMLALKEIESRYWSMLDTEMSQHSEQDRQIAINRAVENSNVSDNFKSYVAPKGVNVVTDKFAAFLNRTSPLYHDSEDAPLRSQPVVVHEEMNTPPPTPIVEQQVPAAEQPLTNNDAFTWSNEW